MGVVGKFSRALRARLYIEPPPNLQYLPTPMNKNALSPQMAKSSPTMHHTSKQVTMMIEEMHVVIYILYDCK